MIIYVCSEDDLGIAQRPSTITILYICMIIGHHQHQTFLSQSLILVFGPFLSLILLEHATIWSTPSRKLFIIASTKPVISRCRSLNQNSLNRVSFVFYEGDGSNIIIWDIYSCYPTPEQVKTRFEAEEKYNFYRLNAFKIEV